MSDRLTRHAIELRRRLLASTILLLLVDSIAAGTALAQGATATDRRLAILRIVQTVEATPFGTSRADWRASRPKAGWRSYRGSPDDLEAPATDGPEGVWCAVAVDEVDESQREAVFYAFREERPIDCRLEEVKYRLAVHDSEADPYETLLAAFSERLGAPVRIEDPEAGRTPTARDLPPAGFWGRKPHEWRSVSRWSTGTSRVLLYRQEQSVQVLVTSSLLHNALRPPATSEKIESTGMDRVYSALLDRARVKFPGAVALKAAAEAVVRDQELVRQTTLAVLEARRRAVSTRERIVLTLLADEVAHRFRIEGETPLKGRPELAPVVGAGVVFRESPFDCGIWYYSGNLAESIRLKYPEAFWGQVLTVGKIEAGWDTFGCDPTYDEVIRKGTAWLKRHSHSEFAPRILLAIAAAYETKWSVSLRPSDAETVAPREAHRARVSAISWYEGLLRQYPSSRGTRDLAWRLRHLRLRVDTGQRRYFCEYA